MRFMAQVGVQNKKRRVLGLLCNHWLFILLLSLAQSKQTTVNEAKVNTCMIEYMCVGVASL